MRKIVLTTVTGFAFGCLLHGQDVRKEAASDLERIDKAYQSLEAVSMNMEYKFFPTATAAEPVEEHTGYYCRQGKENSYTQLYGTLTISNADLVMVKDDSAMVVMVKKQTTVDAQTLSHEQLGQLLTLCSDVNRNGENDATRKGYSLEFKNPLNGMKRIDFFFDPKTFLLDGLVLYYDREVPKRYNSNEPMGYARPRLEVRYVNVATNPVIEKAKFSTDKFLKKDKEKYTLLPGYSSSYELYDQTQIKLK